MLLILPILGIIIGFQENLSGIIVFLILFGLIFVTFLYLIYEQVQMNLGLNEELDFWKNQKDTIPDYAIKHEIHDLEFKWNVRTWKKSGNNEDQIWIDPNPICININKTCLTPVKWKSNLLKNAYILYCPKCNFKQIFYGTIEEYLDEIKNEVSRALSN